MQSVPVQVDAKITILADKLGIERQQLWEAIVRQARVEAWTDVATAVFGILLAVAGAVAIFKSYQRAEQIKDNWGDWPTFCILGCLFGGIAVVIGLIVFAINAYNAALIFPNPVFYAYTHLLY